MTAPREDGNETDARLRDRAHGLQGDIPRRFDFHRAADEFHPPFHLRNGEIIEHDAMDARARQRFPHLVQVSSLHFHPDVQPSCLQVAEAALHRGSDSARGGDMVILDQHHVVEPKAVIDASSKSDRELVEDAQSGRGLSRIGDAGAGPLDGIDILPGQGRDAAHALQNIERRPLGLQDPREGAFDCGDKRPRLHGRPVPAQRLHEEIGIDKVKRQRGDIETRDDAPLLRRNAAPAALIGRHDRVGGDVAHPEVFHNRFLEQPGDAAVRVHRGRHGLPGESSVIITGIPSSIRYLFPHFPQMSAAAASSCDSSPRHAGQRRRSRSSFVIVSPRQTLSTRPHEIARARGPVSRSTR
jgi:hypothetical protein